ncbi:hypothetical protein ACWDR3_00610 [Streptomyces sp. NPDC001002]
MASRTGVHYSTGQEQDLSLAQAWHRLDTSAADGAHDVSLAVTGTEGALSWSAPDGLRVVRLTRGSLDQPSPARPGPLRRHAAPAVASAGAPLTALLADGELDLLWSPDRHTVLRLDERPGLPAHPEPRPELTLRGERLKTLDVALESPKTAWLAATTERGALLLARWDLVYDVHDPWTHPRCPLPTVSRAVVTNVSGVPVVLATSGGGRLLACDARDAAADQADWEPVDAPARTPVPSAIEVLAAADCQGAAWLAVATHGHLWSAPLRRTGRRITCGEAVEVTVD